MSGFAGRIRAERELAGLTRRGLSRAAGLTKNHAGRLEDGEIGATTAGAEAVATALGLVLADLILDGPPLFELEFEIGQVSGVDIERLALAAVPGDMLPGRVAVWPWSDDGCLRLRARASCLPALINLAGTAIPGLTDTLPRPRVWPVGPSSDLAVLVRAHGSRAATRTVLTEAARVNSCPPVDAQHRGRSLWLVRLSSVSERCSMALQRLAPESPIGLFVPA